LVRTSPPLSIILQNWFETPKGKCCAGKPSQKKPGLAPLCWRQYNRRGLEQNFPKRLHRIPRG
jgi:hypothetical protein